MDNVYAKYQTELAKCIFCRANGEIPKEMCIRLAIIITNRKKDNQLTNYTLEECADMAIKNYFA